MQIVNTTCGQVFEKGSISRYLIIIAKVFESKFEDIELKVVYDYDSKQLTGFIILSNLKNNLTFMTVRELWRMIRLYFIQRHLCFLSILNVLFGILMILMISLECQ